MVGLLRQLGKDLGPGLPSLMAMADGMVRAAPKLPILRLVAASLSLGSGASLGPEGPSVEGGGNIGLWVGLRSSLSPESQKALVAAGLRPVWRPGSVLRSLGCSSLSKGPTARFRVDPVCGRCWWPRSAPPW